LAAVVVAVGVASDARAGVIIGNLNGNDLTQSADLTTLRNKGMGFAIPDGLAFTLEAVTLRLQTFGGVVSPVIQLWSNTATNVPGVPLLTFTNPTAFAATGIDNYDFLAPNPFVLQPGTAYWIVATDTGPGRLDWKASVPNVVPTGLATHFGSLFDANGVPPTTPSAAMNSYAVRAAVVPEPATLTLFAVGTAGLVLARRRRLTYRRSAGA
jgi:hypothetical protein